MARKKSTEVCHYCGHEVVDDEDFSIKILIRQGDTAVQERRQADTELLNRPIFSTSSPAEKHERSSAQSRSMMNAYAQGEFERQVPRCEECAKFHRRINRWLGTVIIGAIAILVVGKVIGITEIAIGVAFVGGLVSYVTGLFIITRRNTGRRLFSKQDLGRNGYVDRFRERIVKITR